VRLAQEPKGQALVKFAQGLENLRQERREDVAALRWISAQAVQNGVLESGYFEFDVEEGGSLVARKDLIEFRQARKISGAGSCDLNAVNFRVMADQGAAVGRAAHVEFKAVASVGKGEIERREGVFRDNAGSTGAAVAEQERAGH
jgi:hypothetical protein